jgi:hypothetical protein
MADEAPPTASTDSASSSPSPESTAAPSPSPSPASSTPAAEPSSVPSGDTPSKSTLLDAVLKVVPATNERDVLAKDPDPSAPQDDTQPENPDQAEKEDQETDEGVDDDEQAPQEAAPVIRKKINKLLKQRRELRNEVAALRPAAEIGSELEQFASQNKLSGEDVASTLRLAAMLRAGDYATFYKTIAPFVRTAQEYLGVVLPKDLSERVRAGHMTETAAKEFARQRYDNQRTQFELRETHQETQVSQVRAVQADVQRAVSNFELRLSASDPDYKAKAPSVRRAAQAMLFERGGTISTVEEALKITKDAYDEVNRQMRSISPRPSSTPKHPNGASPPSSARAAPKNLMEAAIQGLENARRAGG